MAAKSADSPRIVPTAGDLGDTLARFRRSLRAENVSPNMLLAYCGPSSGWPTTWSRRRSGPAGSVDAEHPPRPRTGPEPLSDGAPRQDEGARPINS